MGMIEATEEDAPEAGGYPRLPALHLERLPEVAGEVLELSPTR
jgi:hypothetical protein